MSFEHFFGTLTLLFGVLTATIGLTAQVIKNYREKRCGNAFLLMALAMLTNLSRIGYATTINSWYLIIPDAVGTILSFVTLYQFVHYRKSRLTENVKTLTAEEIINSHSIQMEIQRIKNLGEEVFINDDTIVISHKLKLIPLTILEIFVERIKKFDPENKIKIKIAN